MSSNFVLVTDSSCDLPESYLTENNIAVVQLSFSMDSTTYKGNELPPKEFYKTMRSGTMPITAQTNQQEFRDFFTPLLEEGKDILYIAFSSGLSGTCASGQATAKELNDEYPDRKVLVVDSLCASLGQGLLVYKVNELINSNATLEEAYQYAEATKLKVGHSFTVADLMHLHRGGRVSKASAIAGSLLGIKPVLHVDKEGHLVPTGKVRGESVALIRVVDQMEKWVGKAPNDIVMISHADAIENAEIVADLIRKRFGIDNILINYVGPVIGTHSGPGTIALFMMVEARQD